MVTREIPITTGTNTPETLSATFAIGAVLFKRPQHSERNKGKRTQDFPRPQASRHSQHRETGHGGSVKAGHRHECFLFATAGFTVREKKS